MIALILISMAYSLMTLSSAYRLYNERPHGANLMAFGILLVMTCLQLFLNITLIKYL